jgi:hypothetical protein
MPELPKEESQSEMGWEDLTAHDDGRPDMGEATASEPAKEPEPDPQPAEEPAALPPEPAPEPEAEEGEAAKAPEGTEEEPPEEEPVYTLPGGVKVKQGDLAKDPKLLGELVTQSNQLSHFQTLAEERNLKLTEMEQANRQLLDQYTQWEMQRKAAAEQQPDQEPVVRPPAKVLESMYAPQIDQMVTEGRITEDQRHEFGGFIAEHMHDVQILHSMVNAVVDAGRRRFEEIDSSLKGELIPDVERRQQQDAVQADKNVHMDVASRPGYEALAEPGEWNRLKLFIANKVNASPKDKDGNPTFDPVFDGDTMAQMYDAMTGAETRAALQQLREAKEAADKQTTAMAGGETAARAATPPQPPPPEMTPEDEAMTFSDPSMATG